MTEQQLKALLDNYIDDSQNAYKEVDGDVQKATDYYLGKPYGNEVTGKSSVTTREVAEAVAEEPAEEIAEDIKLFDKKLDPIIAQLGPVIGAHLGPNVLGLGYIKSS